MSGNGRGSVNAKLDTFRSAGKKQAIALQVLANVADGLEHAKENVRPSQLAKVRKAIDLAAEKTAVARQVLQKTGQAWQRAANVDYAVRSEVTQMRKTTLTNETALRTLQEYNASDLSGKTPCATQMDTVVDCGTSMRGAYEVRQRTINVAGHDIVAPANGTWYQTSEAVRILLDLKQRQIRIAHQLVDVWRSKTPPWIGMSYQKLMKHVQRVEEDMCLNNCTVDESIKCLLTDRTAVDHIPRYGRPRYLSESAFVAGMLDSGRQEEASGKQLAVKMLNDAKIESYERRGLRPPKAQVHQNTVLNYWQHLGGKEAPLRTKVSERSHARGEEV